MIESGCNAHGRRKLRDAEATQDRATLGKQGRIAADALGGSEETFRRQGDGANQRGVDQQEDEQRPEAGEPQTEPDHGARGRFGPGRFRNPMDRGHEHGSGQNGRQQRRRARQKAELKPQ
jgi:hypothetical protein